VSCPNVTLGPLELTRICDDACNARAQEIVEFLHACGANGPYYASLVKHEFLGEYIRTEPEGQEQGTQRRGG
jgi:hypothetical protein